MKAEAKTIAKVQKGAEVPIWLGAIAYLLPVIEVISAGLFARLFAALKSIFGSSTQLVVIKTFLQRLCIKL